ncbi:MAG: hypothetical protein IT256_00675 [Chitinophagaceae bacterium]|nr:hypothetical protein [Chitinophagaceae bacterium]
MEITIIASSQNNKQRISKLQWLGYALVGVLLAIGCFYFFDIGEGIPALLLFLLFGGLIGKLVWNDKLGRKLKFSSYTSNNILTIEFEKVDNNNNRKTYKRIMPMASLKAYTIHSFFGMKPSFIELEQLADEDTIVKVLIPLEALTNEERNKFITYIHQLLPNKTPRLPFSKNLKRLSEV